jgi:hypothetical protein
MKDDHGNIHGDNRWQEGGFSLLKFPRILVKKTRFGWGAKKTPIILDKLILTCPL